MSLRVFGKMSGAAALLLPLCLGACVGNTLRVATHAQLKTLDPIWTTAYITRTHGYLVYDTLFAMDETFTPRPQMVDTWSVSPDQKTWRFKLRDGLRWDDGMNVTAEDCVASLERWGKRDGMGQRLFSDIESLTAPDARTIVMKLKVPDDMVLQALAKMSSNVPFMMPKRIAETDPFQPITDPTGSGPYMFKQSSWVPGSKAVYVKNPYYVPRPEPASLAAGGKVAKANEIDLLYFGDQNDAAKALMSGRVDYFESPSTKLVQTLEADKNVVVTSTDPLGSIGMVRFNFLQPPFNNPKIRRAVLMAIDQEAFMKAALGDHRYWRTCYSVFPCGTAYASDASEMSKTADFKAAERLLATAHYDGTPVVILNPTDSVVLSAFTQVMADMLRQLGMKVDVQDMDWATLLQRRDNRGPVSQGGWNMFPTWWIAADVMDPSAIAFSGDPVNGWVGWPKDQQLEADRIAFAGAHTPDEKKQLAAKVQQRILDIGAFGVLGQFFEPVAFRKDVKGITSPIQFFWNLSPE